MKCKLLSFFLLVLSLCSCNRRIIVNNAFVYLVHDSCIAYGTIKGEQWQSVFVGDYSIQVTAVPKEGYRFIEWSDGLKEMTRSDMAINENDSGPVVFYAFFEVIEE